MIRVVLDTNVLISALLTKKLSAPLKLYKAFTTKQFILITSPSIIEEIEDVIGRENVAKYHKLTFEQQKQVIEQLVRLSFVTFEAAAKEKVIIERDPDDDKFIYAAIGGNADYIVSGDRHLLDLKEHKGIKIITPGNFLRILERQSQKRSN